MKKNSEQKCNQLTKPCRFVPSIFLFYRFLILRNALFSPRNDRQNVSSGRDPAGLAEKRYCERLQPIKGLNNRGRQNKRGCCKRGKMENTEVVCRISQCGMQTSICFFLSLPPLYFPLLYPLLSSLLPFVHPLNPARGLGSAVLFPRVSG